MIHDLLDFTQAKLSGSIPLVRRTGDLHAIVRQVVEELQVAHPERTFDVQHDGNAQGAWDAGRMAQVVGNLLSNAITYSPAGSVVRVSTRNDGGVVVLAIQNDGPPIRTDLLPHLFEPMRRASAELNNASRSVGLGLYIVKHVVEAHGETRAVGDEFFERGALFGNTRRDDLREHRTDGGEQTQAEDDQQCPSEPVARRFQLFGVKSPLLKGRPGHFDDTSPSHQHHVVLVEPVKRFHLQPYRPAHLVLELGEYRGLLIQQAVDHVLMGQN
jgi:hypothetical protein